MTDNIVLSTKQMKQEQSIENSYKILFQKTAYKKAPYYVLLNIENSILAAKTRHDTIRGTSYAVITCLTIAAFIPAFKSMLDAMVGSGFTSYFSMILTDGASMLGSWKELSMALIETLPVLSIMAVLALLIGSLYSMSKSIAYIRDFRALRTH